MLNADCRLLICCRFIEESMAFIEESMARSSIHAADRKAISTPPSAFNIQFAICNLQFAFSTKVLGCETGHQIVNLAQFVERCEEDDAEESLLGGETEPGSVDAQ